MSARILLVRTITLAALAVALIWPAFCNRGPFFYYDTRSYIRSADAILHKLTGIDTDWTPANQPAGNQAASTAAGSPLGQNADALHNLGVARSRSVAEIKGKGVLLGRSPYYGLLLYLGALTGGFWLTLLLQSTAVLCAIYLLLRSLAIPAWPLLAYLGAGLCLLSDVPFFISYLMPDLFAGIAILATAILVTKPQTLTAGTRACWFVLLTASLLAHDSCLLIAASLLAVSVLISVLGRRRFNWRELGIVVLALVIAVSSQMLVAFGIHRATGEAPLRIPFLSARLIADGPGTNYLRATCPTSGFLLCQYLNEFPLPSHKFLWSAIPGESVFETATYEQRYALSAEQIRFFLAVTRYDPSGVLKAIGRNVITQLFDFRLTDFNYPDDEKDIMDRTFPLKVLSKMKAGAAYRGTLPVDAFDFVLYATVFGSIACILLASSGRLPGRPISRDLQQVSWLVLAGVVVNAIICGGISTVASRFQARVMWLLPLMALTVVLSGRVRLGSSLHGSRSASLPLDPTIHTPTTP